MVKKYSKFGIGSLSLVFFILGFLTCTIQTKSLSEFLKASSLLSMKSLLGIGLIFLSYITAKKYPNHMFATAIKKIDMYLIYIFLGVSVISMIFNIFLT